MDGRKPQPMRGAGALTWAGAATAVCLSAVCTAPAFAQVIEVGPAGASTISGPTVFTPEGATAIAATTSPAKSSRLAAAQPLLQQAGNQADLSPRLLEAIAYVESRFKHDAISPKGAQGMMQLMPGTAAELGVDATDPEGNVKGGAQYLRRLVTMFGNNVELAIAAYNAGPSAVLKYGGVPPYAETRAYVDAVMDYLAKTSVSETD